MMSVLSADKARPGFVGRVVGPVPVLDWLVLASASRARVFERDADNGALREIVDRVPQAGRLPARGLGADAAGGARKSAVWAAFQPHAVSGDREPARFAREFARLLEDAALARRMPGLVLLASSPFLSMLHAHLGPATQRRLKASVARDLTSYQGLDLERRVTRTLGQAPGRDGYAGCAP